MPETHSQPRSTREECQPGDFVEVSLIPEWIRETAPQEFRSRTYDLSPAVAGFGGTLPAAASEVWIFRRQSGPSGDHWIRVS